MAIFAHACLDLSLLLQELTKCGVGAVCVSENGQNVCKCLSSEWESGAANFSGIWDDRSRTEFWDYIIGHTRHSPTRSLEASSI